MQQSLQQQRKFLSSFGQTILNIKHWEDWYRVTTESLKQHGGGAILQQYNNIPSLLLKATFPEYAWVAWKFSVSRVPNYFWSSIQHQREFLDWIAENKLNIKCWQNWYSITNENLYESGVGGLLTHHYSSSASEMLQAVYPEYKWLLWEFVNVPHYMLYNRQKQRQYLDWIGKTFLSIQHWADWYNITNDTFWNKCRSALFRLFDSSVIRMLQVLYPEYNWLKWRFSEPPAKCWDNLQNQRYFVDWFGKIHLNIQEWNNWSHITPQQLAKNNSALSLLKLYEDSMSDMLQSIYPEYKVAQPGMPILSDM